MITKTCETKHIPYPFELFGVECGKGWYKLIQPVVDYINEYNKNKTKEEQIQILQIKEKWGYLNLYLNYYADDLHDKILEISNKSRSICEMCGKPAKSFSKHGWVYTLCDECKENL